MRELAGRESVDELSYWNQKTDFSVFEKPSREDRVEERPSREENKLAALNDMIKKQEFKVPSQVDDEDDFDTFLEKLNARRNPDFVDRSPDTSIL
jgi:hypothetical protein